jgi:transcriptional regulator
MYLPNVFREDNPAQLHALIQRYSFGILVTQHDGAPFASHLPFLLDAGRGPYGTLLAHMARANPQWRSFAEQREALVIFQGPHAYISPSWYDVEPSVPTWNYAVVHAYGTPRVIEDIAALRDMLRALVDVHEAAFEQPWEMRLPEDYLHKQMRAIVGFEIPITRLEGKLKLSQNRAEGDRRRVAATLRQSGDPSDADVADLMDAINRPAQHPGMI